MALRVADVRSAARDVRERTGKSEWKILNEAANTGSKSFDVFLSHSFRDRELIIGTKKLIEDTGLTVYVDWIDDPALDRSAVDRGQADHLRTRMRQCATLFYAHTPNAALSRWCPWELGYFDALKAPERQVFILPVESGESYEGQEYLSLYDTVDLGTFPPPDRRPRDQVQLQRAARLLDGLGYPGVPRLRRFF